MREIITLACGECKRRNYSTTKNRRKSSERLEFSKFCRCCRKHTAHKERSSISDSQLATTSCRAANCQRVSGRRSCSLGQ